MQAKLLPQQHVAIMRNPWMDLILQEQKFIESRWTTNKKTPYGIAAPGEVLYFKPTGKPVVARCTIMRADYFNRTTDEDALQEFLKENWSKLGFEQVGHSFQFAADNPLKVHVSMIWIQDLEVIDTFNINKTGFGSMAGWLTLDDVTRIRV